VENCAEKVKKFFKDNLELDEETINKIVFQRCHRLPAQTGMKGPEDIIVRFLSFPERQIVWQARYKLKNTGLSLSEDFPPEINARRQALYPILKAAKSKSMKARMENDKLIIESKTYTIDTLDKLPKELDPALLATKTIGNVTAFFTASSPLSNFAPTSFSIHGKKYFCVEQYFQLQKALALGKPGIAKKIEISTNQAECKRLGESIQITEAWVAKAPAVMQVACEAKFNENERARNFLRSTGNNKLVEASPDLFWGAGKKLKDFDNFIPDVDTWPGKNVLGQILMDIRDRL
jgi:ribA/ribD-fused uncharacterized protein